MCWYTFFSLMEKCWVYFNKIVYVAGTIKQFRRQWNFSGSHALIRVIQHTHKIGLLVSIQSMPCHSFQLSLTRYLSVSWMRFIHSRGNNRNKSNNYKILTLLSVCHSCSMHSGHSAWSVYEIFSAWEKLMGEMCLFRRSFKSINLSIERVNNLDNNYFCNLLFLYTMRNKLSTNNSNGIEQFDCQTAVS